MKIAFLHYHLKPGGVTTVIRQQILAIKDDCEIVVITGQAPEDDFPLVPIVIPEIGYDRHGIPRSSPRIIARKIIQKISEQWPNGCDILHVHNPLLAKNRDLLNVLSALQDSGVCLLLQVHDFAEDGRPGAYYAKAPYPSNCHYSVINSRDYNILLKSGLKKSGLHLLYNMVTPFQTTPEKTLPDDIILYPIRAIRRKNIGEAILLSLFFKENQILAITLPPNSPGDWNPYNRWKEFCKNTNLTILFEASTTYNFTDLVKSAECMITTSIAEGFGFSFLEPWTAGQMLYGRSIPDISDDFKQKGIKLDHLYDKILIPMEMIDPADLRPFFQQWKTCMTKNAAHYNISLSKDVIFQKIEEMASGLPVDFGMMDEPLQQKVITMVLSDRNFRKRLIGLNPFLSDITDQKDTSDIVAHNKLIVENEFGQFVYRNRLLDIYHLAIHQPVDHRIDKHQLAKRFINPKNFSLLKWSLPDV